MGPIHIVFLGEVKPWQLVFFAAGAPGLLLAAVLLAIREPARRGVVDFGRSRMSMREVWDEFLKKRVAFLTLIGAFSLLVMHGHGSGTWIPSFFARQFGWDPGRIGAAYGTIVLLFGTSGALLGGFVSSYLRRRGVAQANVLTCLAGCALATPFALLFPLAPQPEVSLILLAGLNFFAGFPFAGGYAALQELAPNRMRAQAVAVLLVCMNLIGGGFGPTLVALFTDHVFQDPRALPFALSISAAITLPAAIALLLVCAAEARARGAVVRGAPVA